VVAVVATAAFLPTSVQAASFGYAGSASMAAVASAPAAQEDPVERAKALYGEAEKLAEDGSWLAAMAKYEEAYQLVPEKHGFAYKVANAAYQGGDCPKAKQFFEHFIEKDGKNPKQADKVAESKKALAEIEKSKCAEPKPAEPALDFAEENPLDDDNPLTSRRASREAESEKLDRVGARTPRQKLGLLLTVSGGAVALAGGAAIFMAIRAKNKLVDASTPGATDYPTGDYACRDTSKPCPYTLERNLKLWQIGGYTGLAIGGAAIATGVTMIMLENRKKRRSMAANIQVVPAIAPGYVGAAGGMRF
jgi:tetratricopeptide (TPR) repeat protein